MTHGHIHGKTDTHVEKKPEAPKPFTGKRTPGPLVVSDNPTWHPDGVALADYPKWPRNAKGDPLGIGEAVAYGLDAISIDGIADR